MVVVGADAGLIPRLGFLDLYTSMGHRRIELGGSARDAIPLSFELTGSAGEQKQVTIMGRAADGTLLAQRTAQVPLVQGRRSAWLVHLSTSCPDSCAAGCGRCGVCEPSVVDPASLLPLKNNDDGRGLAYTAYVCDPDLSGDGDGVEDDRDASTFDGSTGDAGDQDGDAGDDGDARDGEGPSFPIPDAPVDALTVVAPSAVSAPKGATVTATFSVRVPADSEFPLPLAVSSDVGQVLAADCASAAPTSMAARELMLCVKHTKPNAVRTLPITITATAMGQTASAVVELRMPALQIAGGGGFTCATLEDASLQCWGNPGDLRVPNLGLPDYTTQVRPFRATNAPVFKQIALGGSFGCGLTQAGSVHCWGANYSGQLGRSSATGASVDFTSIANPSAGSAQLSSGISQLSVGHESACAIKDGKIYCWGNSQDFMFGPGVTGGISVPRQVVMPGGAASYALSVAVASRHICAVVGASASDTLGKVYCWGDHSQGRLGDNDWKDQPTTTPVQAHVDTHDERGEILVSRVRAADAQTCAEADGALYCWGANDGYRTGTGLGSAVLAPEPVSFPGRVLDWQMGGPGGCAILGELVDEVQTRRLYCWGSSSYGEFASTTLDASPTPVLIDAAPIDPEGFGLGYGSVCVLKDGLPFCWGNNDSGELATRPLLGAIHEPRLASRLAPLPGIEEISFARAIGGTTCARSGSRVWCWGTGDGGSLGYPGASRRATPVEVQGLSDTTGEVSITQVVSEGGFGCAIVEEELYCWGISPWAALGGSATKVTLPVNKPVRQIGADMWHRMCALVGDPPNAEVYCWKDGVEGPLAFASGNIKALSVAENYLCAIVDDRVQCSGHNDGLRLGTDDVPQGQYSAPVFAELSLAANEKVLKLASRNGRTCAVTNTGDLWCWGEFVPPSVVKIHTATEKAIDVRGNGNNLCYLRSVKGVASELWCEGNNSQNQLTLQTTTSHLSFWRIPKLLPPIRMFEAGGAANLGTICAQDAEGIKCNGNNQVRQRGDGPDYYETTPLPIMGWMN